MMARTPAAVHRLIRVQQAVEAAAVALLAWRLGLLPLLAALAWAVGLLLAHPAAAALVAYLDAFPGDAEGWLELADAQLAIGGALRSDNDEVWGRIVQLAGGKGSRFVVFGTASEDPEASARQAVELLQRRGAVAEALPVAPKFGWVDLDKVVRDPALIAKVRQAKGVFFTGGLQERIVDVLQPRGQPTPMLEAIWDVYRKGGVVAGTSAGAAIMSKVMFRDAPSVMNVLKGQLQDGKQLDGGLGFVGPDVFVDQHFLKRGRFGRMIPAMVAKGYKLGLGVLRLGFELLASMELTELGRPVIEELRERSGYSAHLVVRDGREVVFIAKVAGRSTLFQSIQVGARLPSHATVLGRILLSDLSAAQLGALYRHASLAAYTGTTPTTLSALTELIEQDRQRGHGISMGGYESGISTVAAPVFSGPGKVAAAISVTVPAQRIDEPELSELVASVCDAARQLSERLQHLPGRGPWSPSQRKAA